MYLVASQYTLNRLFNYCKKLIHKQDLVFQNFNQWELQIFLRSTYYRATVLLLFMPMLLVSSRLLSYLIRAICNYFQEWVQRVQFRQHIFETGYSTIEQLKSLREEEMLDNNYIIQSCGHTCTWSHINSENLTTGQIRRLTYQQLFGKTCLYCSESIKNFVVVSQETLKKIVSLAKKMDLRVCCITGEKFTSDTTIGILPCGHYSEYSLLLKWYIEKERCPYCNLKADQITFHRVDRITDYKTAQLLKTLIENKCSHELISRIRRFISILI